MVVLYEGQIVAEGYETKRGMNSVHPVEDSSNRPDLVGTALLQVFRAIRC